MTATARRRIRAALYVVFSLSLATTVLTLFLGGSAAIGLPTGLLAVVLGGLIDSDYPRRKQ
jgi:ABC-type spermidine/putrescine transport system permease subunit II